MGLRLPGLHAVEVFGSGEKWRARSITGKPTDYPHLQRLLSADNARTCVERCFDKMVEPWQAWGTPPGENAARMLDPSEYIELTGNHRGKFAFKTAEDYTHIQHGPEAAEKGKGIPTAACGQQLKAEHFISTKANIRPTCKGCAEVWEREYKNA